jgi:hypothetical protein
MKVFFLLGAVAKDARDLSHWILLSFEDEGWQRDVDSESLEGLSC